MIMFISLRRSLIILTLIRLAQTQFSWYDEKALGTSEEKEAISANDALDSDSVAHTALDSIDNIIERVVGIFEMNKFDISNQVFNIAHELDIPYVQEVRLIYNTMRRLKNKFKSPDAMRIVKDAFNYVKGSPLVNAIKHLVPHMQTCPSRTFFDVLGINGTLTFENVIYQCDSKLVEVDETIFDTSISTRFTYKCVDIHCLKQTIYSPVILQFNDEYHIRMTIDTYYRLSRKPNFYAMLLHLHMSRMHNINPAVPHQLDPGSVSYLYGEMLDSCIVSVFLKQYYSIFLDNYQPVFAVPNQLSFNPRTRFYGFKGSHSFYNNHWKGRDYWTGGMPDRCMRDYVDWSCPLFENCWE